MPRARDLVKQLQQQLHAHAQEVERLERERAALRVREDVLLRSVSQQETVVVQLGQMLASGAWSSHIDAESLGALLKDVQAYQLTAARPDLPHLREQGAATHVARALATFTPERISSIKAASLEQDILPRVRELTLRMSHHMLMLRIEQQEQRQQQQEQQQLAGGGADSTSSISNRVASCSTSTGFLRGAVDHQAALVKAVDAYSELNLLMHTAADDKLVRMCYVDLDTMEAMDAPPGHWERIHFMMELRPEQLEQLAVAYDVWAAKRPSTVAEFAASVSEVQRLLSQTTARVQEASQPLVQQQQQQQQQGGSSSTTTSSSGGSGTAQPAAGASSASAQPSAAGASSAGAWGLAEAGGVMGLEAADELYHALKKVCRLIHTWRELDRCLIMTWINCMTHKQLATASVQSFPLLAQPISLCQLAAAQRQQQAEQRSESG